MDNQQMPFIRALPTAVRLLILGGFLTLLGVLGLPMFLVRADVGSAIGSGCVLAGGLVLLVIGYRRWRQDSPDRTGGRTVSRGSPEKPASRPPSAR